MDVSIIAGRRGEACVDGRIVARIGQWDARAFPGGDWEGSCECEWYTTNDEAAFNHIVSTGVEISLKLFDYNEALYEGISQATVAGELKMMGDVAILELNLRGDVALRRA
jgi:hypothetical protein